jgi:transposase
MRTNARSFAKTSKKLTSNLPEKYTTVAIDQTRKAVGCELYRAWFPEGERIELPYWKTYEGVKLLGAVTEEEELFVTEVADSFKSDVTIQFLKAIQTKFGEQLHIIPDNATYFTSQKVQEFIEESALKVTYLPTGSPDMNPVEECWRQVKRGLGNRFFGSIDELRPAIWAAIDSVSILDVRDYLCPSV